MTALLPWSATMIAPNEDFNGAPLLRKEFALADGHGLPVKAILRATSFGVFEASINGRPVGEDVLSRAGVPTSGGSVTAATTSPICWNPSTLSGGLPSAMAGTGATCPGTATQRSTGLNSPSLGSWTSSSQTDSSRLSALIRPGSPAPPRPPSPMTSTTGKQLTRGSSLMPGPSPALTRSPGLGSMRWTLTPLAWQSRSAASGPQ